MASAVSDRRHSPEPLMTERDLAATLQVSLACVRKWRLEGRGPKWNKPSPALVRYDPADVLSWLSSLAGGGGEVRPTTKRPTARHRAAPNRGRGKVSP